MAFGTDINGFIHQVGPRFGDGACFAHTKLGKGRGRADTDRPAGVSDEFNTRGLAHIGLLPDLLADLQALNTPGADALANSAETFIQMWERAYDAELPVISNEACSNEADCPQGWYCNTGFVGVGANTCKQKLGRWKSCTKDHQCKSGECKSAICVDPGSIALGDTCHLDVECSKGTCSSAVGAAGITTGKCVCTQDGHCADGYYCNTGVAGVGTNVCKRQLADGTACTKNHQCQSGDCRSAVCISPDSVALSGACSLDVECKKGTCSSAVGAAGITLGKCVCTEDSHCDSGEYCNEGVADIGTNTCKDKLDDGAVCTKAHMCEGGACNVRCYTPASKSIGESCNLNAECKKGKCSGTGWGAVSGKCVCEKDADCASGKYCNKGVAGIGTNVCKSKLDLGEACTKKHQCKSGCCKLYNLKMQCRPSNKCG